MERRKLGALEVSAIGLGCATMTPFYGRPDPQQAAATVRRAAELGIDLIDTADAYGEGANEELIGAAIRGHRSRYVIASKFGNLRRKDGSPYADGRPDYVKSACEKSLARLGIDVIELYYIHRVDPEVPIEDTVGAMSELVGAGKVRHLGISEAGPRTIRRAHAVHPLSAVQIEYSLWSREVEAEVLPLCRALGIGVVAYSPLGRAFGRKICRAIWRSSPSCAGSPRPKAAARRSWRSPGSCRAGRRSCRSPAPAARAGSTRTPAPPASSSPPQSAPRSTAFSPSDPARFAATLGL